MISLGVVVALAYFGFVYFSDTFNPFIKPKAPGPRVRWRYGRKMGLAVLIAGCCALVFKSLFGGSMYQIFGVGFLIATILGLCFSIGRIRSSVQGE